jgi:O-antigen biosynthesis protein
MQNDLISIIIINYNQKNFLIDCIKSIYNVFQSFPFELIIMNNSPEENIDFLESEYKNLKIIENQNKGFAQANNLGAEYSSGDYLFFLNPDTVIQKDFLNESLKVFENNDCGAVGLSLVNQDNSFQVSFGFEVSILNEIKNSKLEKISREHSS